MATPLDPQSERGRRVARELTLLLDRVVERLAADKAAALTRSA